MLSHLRLHRRAPSNPTSPVPPDLPSPSPLDQQNDASASSPADLKPPSSSAPSTLPPTLPPITCVTSDTNLDLDFQNMGVPQTQYAHQQHQPSSPHPTPQRSPYTEHTGFIGGVALQNYRRGLQAGGQSGPISLGNSAVNSPVASASDHDSRSPIHRPTPSPINSTAPSKSIPAPRQRQGKLTPSFITPTDLQNAQSSTGTGGKTTGKRPSGAKLSTEPTISLSVPAPDPPKAKKGLPFLKNPMSTLLMRRKSSQPIPDILPLPLGTRKDEAPNDPSIRGTRVHDFSMPRSKRVVSSISPSVGSSSGLQQQQPYPVLQQSSEALPISQQPGNKNQTHPIQPDQKLDSAQPTENQVRSISSVSTSSQQASGVRDNNDPSGLPRPLSLERKPVPGKYPPPVPPKDKPPSVSSRPSTTSKTASVDTISVLQKSTSSNRTKSRNVSVSERLVRDISGSSVPKHMKSTSSRFSFDMIGAAKQEKLLEERHRQRQQEKETAEPGDRDSRFDDFDEDCFDYDAMDFDDGLEEPIPGVNADYDDDDFFEEPIPGINTDLIEEEEDSDAANDPDNDQENFAGFVFQRSNPASTLASPLSPNMATTPRDAEGKVIGFAVTKDTTPNPNMLSPAMIPDTPPRSPEDVDGLGLGIQGLNITKENEATAGMETDVEIPGVAPQVDFQPRHLDPSDELYFDNGLREFEGENIDDGEEPFDESLFDLDDTDRFGRPLPGVFAQAKSMRQSQRKKQRESDGTSRLSGLSGASEPSTHTSLDSVVPAPLTTTEPSTGKPAKANNVEIKDENPSDKTIVSPSQQEQIAAYQAALAAAAYEAAASGKFRRDSSPPLAEVMITSPTTTTSSQHDMGNLDDFEDNDGFGNDFDDYEFDDDAMVAEANASVLANDSDGFYGQEFGFYSAPVAQPPHHGGVATTALSTENLFQYANGGYFGPSGVNRTTSGRVVSREPNLTPITERSEYSNRNSVMSGMGIPPMGGGSNPLSSPGLAQLAALASEDADDDTMSLSALLKLRSRAWGGSQASLASSKDGSPRSETGREGAISPWGTGSGIIGVGGAGAAPTSSGLPPLHARKGSTFSIMSRDSEPGSGSASPTLTMSIPMYQQLPPTSQPSSTSPGPNNAMGLPSLFSPQQQAQQLASFFPPLTEDDEPSPESESSPESGQRFGLQMRSPELISDGFKSTPILPQPQPPGSGNVVGLRRGGVPCHRKKGSADSISYTKEKEEESGETRWVIERRRTAESGEVEILGREVLEGGRI